MNMSFCHLLLWRPSQPSNWGSLGLFQSMTLRLDFLLNFQGCIAAPVSAVTVMVQPWHPREERVAGKEYTQIIFSTSSTVPQAPVMGRKSVPRTSSALWRLCAANLRSAPPLLPQRTQDDTLSAASSVHLGGVWSSWLCPVQWKTSCSTHAWWHHYRSAVLRPPSASCWQGDFVFLYARTS